MRAPLRGLRRLLLLCSLRLSKRRDFVEPRLRRFLGGGAGLRIELVDDIVKFKIGLAAGSPVPDRELARSRRIGISRAVDLPYRFTVVGSRSLSKWPRGA